MVTVLKTGGACLKCLRCSWFEKFHRPQVMCFLMFFSKYGVKDTLTTIIHSFVCSTTDVHVKPKSYRASRKKVQLPRNATSSFGMNVLFSDIRKHFWVLGPTYFDSASNFSSRTVCPVLNG